MTTLKPTKGKLLIAEPSILSDSSFNRSVVYLTEHNDKGSVGFIMNKPSPYTIGDLIPEIESDLKVFSEDLSLKTIYTSCTKFRS